MFDMMVQEGRILPCREMIFHVLQFRKEKASAIDIKSRSCMSTKEARIIKSMSFGKASI